MGELGDLGQERLDVIVLSKRKNQGLCKNGYCIESGSHEYLP